MNENDRELGAAWRSASREEPSKALDDAIRAAARREVAAGPRGRRTRAWWPLAAAATIAVLAIGIAQLTPPERVSPDNVADVRVAPAPDKVAANQVAPAQPATKPDAEADSLAAARNDKPAIPAGAASQPRKESPRRQSVDEQMSARTRDRADASQVASAEDAQASEREKKQKSELASATAAAPAADAGRTADTARSVPFPASAPPEKPAEQPMLQMRAPASAAAPSPPPPAVAGALAQNAEPAAEKRMAMAKTSRSEVPRENNAPPRPVDEWIRQIRRLIAEGKRDDAAKELTSFREFYKDRADALLPSDLREFKR